MTASPRVLFLEVDAEDCLLIRDWAGRGVLPSFARLLREGLFIAMGPGIRPGRMQRRVSIMDFAPTFCALLGTSLPGADGEPIGEIVAAA